MSILHKIQTSFSGGEISPNLYSRVDLNKYSTSLKKAKNFIIHPHGGASNRVGTKYTAETKTSAKKSRLVKFVFSDTQKYQIEFGDGYVRFYKDHAVVNITAPSAWVTATPYVAGDFAVSSTVNYYCLVSHTSGTFATDLAAGKWVAQTIYEVPTPYGENDLADLKFERSADVLYIFHPDYKIRTLSRYDDDDWSLDTYVNVDGPFMSENLTTTTTLAVSAVTGTAVNVVATAAVFDAGHVGSMWKLTHYVEGQTITSAFTGTATSGSISCFTTWRVISHGTWTAKFKIEKSIDAGVTWTALREFSGVNDFNVNTYGTEDIELNTEPFLLRLRCHSFTSGTCNVDLTTDPFYQNGIIQVNTVTNSTAGVASVLTAVASTAATYSWSEGAWSDYRGWPSTGAFYQDRLCPAATDSEPMNIWMSETGIYTSYRVNSNVLDTDSINVKLLSRQLNAVNSLVPLGNLIALTTSSEWNIGADKTVLTPSTIFAKVQGYRGASSVTPVIIGNQMVYVQSNGTIVRNFGYDYATDSYTGVDLRVLAEHLFSGYTIVDMDYQQDNDSIVWFVRSDGKLLSMTYMVEQEVIAWSWHETDGEVESVSVIPGDGFDEVWLIVKRGSKRFVEYMPKRLASLDIQDQYFVDCGISYDNPIEDIVSITAADPVVITTTANHGLSNDDLIDISDIVGMTELNGNRYKVSNKTDKTFELKEEDSVLDIDGTAFTAYVSGAKIRKTYTTFSGLTHLEGETVTILGNGEVYPQQVVTGGEVTLSRACSRIHVGLPYESDLETLNVEVAAKDGTSQGRKVKIGNVTFRFISSRGGWIGPDEDNLYEAFVPTRDSLGKPSPLFSGDIREGLGAGYEDGGRIFYRQVDPLPVTITCVIPELVVS